MLQKLPPLNLPLKYDPIKKKKSLLPEKSMKSILCKHPGAAIETATSKNQFDVYINVMLFQLQCVIKALQ